MSEIVAKITDFARVNYKAIGITVAVVVVLYVVYVLFFRTEGFDDESFEDERKADEGFYAEEVVIEEADPKDDKKRVVLFYAPWCPHCKSMMEGDQAVWPALGRRFRGHPKIEVKEVNCDEKPDLANKNGVKGFPTIMMFHKGQRYVYDGDRSLDSLEKFVSGSN